MQRGTCLTYPHIARQYTSEHENATFFDITNHSCLNSWLGGNVAPRPTDVARFTYASFRNDSKALISTASLAQMLDYAPLTDGFAAYTLSYGLGVEGRWAGIGLPSDVCGFDGWGHAGLDYGSGSLLNFYLPQLRLGVSMAMTSGLHFGASLAGMNCSRAYVQLGVASMTVQSSLMHALAEDAGLPTSCAPTNFTPPSAADCQDASSVGTFGAKPLHCSDLFAMGAQRPSHLNPFATCTYWLAVTTLAKLEQQLPGYRPPDGVDPTTTFAIDMCKASCGRVGAGPCWLLQSADPWC